MKGKEDLSEKRKFRREIEVEKNTVTKVSDDMTRISGKVDGWENIKDHWKGYHLLLVPQHSVTFHTLNEKMRICNLFLTI